MTNGPGHSSASSQLLWTKGAASHPPTPLHCLSSAIKGPPSSTTIHTTSPPTLASPLDPQRRHRSHSCLPPPAHVAPLPRRAPSRGEPGNRSSTPRCPSFPLLRAAAGPPSRRIAGPSAFLPIPYSGRGVVEGGAFCPKPPSLPCFLKRTPTPYKLFPKKALLFSFFANKPSYQTKLIPIRSLLFPKVTLTLSKITIKPLASQK